MLQPHGHNGGVTNRRSKRRNRTIDPILLSEEAVHIAREALEELGDDEVGKHLGVTATAGGTAVHRFVSEVPGYSGWEWIAVLASVPGSGEITVNEVSLQAGRDAKLAPEWVPYEDRVQPGDLGPGDVLPPRLDDNRLIQWRALDAFPDGNQGFPRNPAAEDTLSEQGLQEAVARWRATNGADSDFAQQAEFNCETCAFYLPFNSMETGLGVCANEYSADGQVVSQEYGCGAHSATKDDTYSEGRREYGAFDDGRGVDRWGHHG